MGQPFRARISSPGLASLGLATIGLLSLATSCATSREPEVVKVEFPAADGLVVTADLRMAWPEEAPFIVLCHMADSGRREYAPVAGRLARLGFNSLALDQRSGRRADGVENETAARARSLGLGTGWAEAEPDLEAALAWARKEKARGKLLLWGSSYSASLALILAGEEPGSCDAVLAFSPGEYFGGGRAIEAAAAGIVVPAFLASARAEAGEWDAIYGAIPSPDKVAFVPRKGTGAHGTPALYEGSSGSGEYWEALSAFLRPFAGKRVL